MLAHTGPTFSLHDKDKDTVSSRVELGTMVGFKPERQAVSSETEASEMVIR